MINCIIVDDEIHAIEVLQHHIKSIAQLNLIACFTKPTEAITFLNGQQVDLIFLDIHMPEISGIEFIQAVRHISCHFILTTAYREFAADGFDLDVVDYLIKPISLNRFLQGFTKAQRAISSKTDHTKDSIETDYFMVKSQIKGNMIKINLADIDYIEGMKNYVAFHHKGIRTVALITMKDIEGKLPDKYFMRIQKSFIIALNKVTALNGNRVILKDVSSEILIGETYKQHFLETIKKKQII
ncbi:response regulator transcription factor [Pedobacter sp. ISL-68]|uniref:LytR/AlgR family response regulator transcription factor n=1 Tax=unclassified Pedobacter TaxID=2628915 RepID=UPI001BE7311C|nr:MULTISPECIES: LytTR family DNA-binding domain-containing protein [unclassified Pedobacter]MBT2559778.1 response regulator transcription factor [Pedobacter sp. ISL-64]MBT2592083.1 response regulator transcription factor [Pedobacter sp. ISL-68]